MKQTKSYEDDLASIRTVMERSDKVISLSGLSGILAGVYALCGAAAAYALVQYPLSPLRYRIHSVMELNVLAKLIGIATLVLLASLLTGLWLSHRKAQAKGENLWNATSRRLLINLCIPLVTGGLFILILLYSGHYGVAAPASLIFYGLALIQGSANTFDEVRYLGFSEIALGLVSALWPGFGLIFWALGFGLLHIIYGSIMYHKYDR